MFCTTQEIPSSFLISSLIFICVSTAVAQLMELKSEENQNKQLLQAHTNVYKTLFGFANTMSLLSAVQLGIPDIITQHGGAISLSDLAAAIGAPPSKTKAVGRLMRLLVLNNIFNTKVGSDGEVLYTMMPSATLLTKEHAMSMLPFVLVQDHPLMTAPRSLFQEWLRRDGPVTPFEMAHGFSIYEGDKSPAFAAESVEVSASDSRLFMAAFVRQCREHVEGVRSMVDVGGGVGISAKTMVEAFPGLKVKVLDKPHVIAAASEVDGVEFVGGDMFDSVPSAQAGLIKWVLNSCTDEECVKVLQNCRKAIPSRDAGGKVIIIDMVLAESHNDQVLSQAQLSLDVVTMLYFQGKERLEREWQKILEDAGFPDYQIAANMGVRSVIVAYP